MVAADGRTVVAFPAAGCGVAPVAPQRTKSSTGSERTTRYTIRKELKALMELKLQSFIQGLGSLPYDEAHSLILQQTEILKRELEEELERRMLKWGQDMAGRRQDALADAPRVNPL